MRADTSSSLWIVGVLLLAVAPFSASCREAGAPSEESDAKRAVAVEQMIDKLRPLHQPLGKAQPGDWLTQHKEPGQTFQEYLRSEPVRPVGKRNVIYIQPLGGFTKTQRKIVDATGQYLACVFGVPVKVKDDLPLSVIPDKARRVHPTWGDKQILSTHVLDEVLKPRLPDDAAAYIAFTASDLWPGRNWNFVFGQASLRDRVGVWSIYRNGDPDKSEEAYKLCLVRTLKTAAHETGHMFSMYHCTAYECCMCGSNNLPESDRRPLWFCALCEGKVIWSARLDPAERYRKLAAFCKEQGLEEEEAFYIKSLNALGK